MATRMDRMEEGLNSLRDAGLAVQDTTDRDQVLTGIICADLLATGPGRMQMKGGVIDDVMVLKC